MLKRSLIRLAGNRNPQTLETQETETAVGRPASIEWGGAGAGGGSVGGTTGGTVEGDIELQEFHNADQCRVDVPIEDMRVTALGQVESITPCCSPYMLVNGPYRVPIPRWHYTVENAAAYQWDTENNFNSLDPLGERLDANGNPLAWPKHINKLPAHFHGDSVDLGVLDSLDFLAPSSSGFPRWVIINTNPGMSLSNAESAVGGYYGSLNRTELGRVDIAWPAKSWTNASKRYEFDLADGVLKPFVAAWRFAASGRTHGTTRWEVYLSAVGGKFPSLDFQDFDDIEALGHEGGQWIVEGFAMNSDGTPAYVSGGPGIRPRSVAWGVIKADGKLDLDGYTTLEPDARWLGHNIAPYYRLRTFQPYQIHNLQMHMTCFSPPSGGFHRTGGGIIPLV